MGVPAGLLNRRVTFLRRTVVPTAAYSRRQGFAPYGEELWAGYRPKGTTDITIGGMQLQATTGVLTVRDSDLTRTITTRDQVTVDGELFEIFGRQIGEKPDGMIRFDLRTAPSRDMYAREFDARGDVATIRRVMTGGATVEALARAIFTGFQPDELAGGIVAGERRVYLSAQDLEAAGYPVPPRANDKLVLFGGTRVLNILTVDDFTHRFAGELHVYDIRAAG